MVVDSAVLPNIYFYLYTYYTVKQLLNVSSLETQLMKRFCKLCNVMCHSKNNFVSFMFKFCISKATSLISRKLFYISSIFKVKVNDMLNDNVKLSKHDDNEEQVRQTEFLREMLEIRDTVIGINGLNYNEIQDMIDHVSSRALYNLF